MIFNSLQFMIFFPIVVIVYFTVPHKYRYIWLLFCSYFFYMCQDNHIVLLLILSTVITFTSGRLVANANGVVFKKIYLSVGILINLLILIYFKYAGMLHLFGMMENSLVLPVGISFYTFQSLSYVIDCYRGDVKVENNILKYALFVSFFPNILSGPIAKSKDFLEQIDEKHEFDAIRVKEGLFLMLFGYFLKIVIVGRLSILTELVYSENYLGVPMLVAMFAYAFQIYCDFAGYSYIAIGAARIMGFELMRNFKQPYLAMSVADFWRRWHISLSTWFRDYLYFPLGGSRVSAARRYFNLIVVFLVSGIWHGASYTFAVWGLLYGIYQVLGIATKPLKQKLYEMFGLQKHERIHSLLCRVFTFCLVSVTWMFFRSDNISSAIATITGCFKNFNVCDFFNGTLFNLGLGSINLCICIFSILLLIAVDLVCEKRQIDVYELFNTTNVFVRWIFYYLILILIIYSSNLSTTEFMYQRF